MVIVTDSSNPSKTAQAPVTSRGPGNADPSDERPPAYSDNPGSAEMQGSLGSNATSSHGQRMPLFAGRDPQQTASKRFCKALLFAVVIYFLMGALIRSFFDLANHGSHHWGDSGGVKKDWPEFPAGEVRKCVDRNDWAFNGIKPKTEDGIVHSTDMILETPSDMSNAFPHSKSMSFKLPASADTLYFLSRGSLAHGSFKVDVASDVGHDVIVDVQVSYYTESALERVSVCKLVRDGNKHGVGIFTPRNWHSRSSVDQLRFDIVVRIPKNSSGSQRRINNFETDFSIFTIDIGNILKYVTFGSLDLATSNAHINSEGVSAADTSLKSSNAPITGTYNSSSTIKLVTSNARIQAHVNLESDRINSPTDLVLKTSDGVIDSTVSLYATDSGANSAFSVQSITSNAHNNITVLEQPLESFLKLDAKTANAKSDVSLHRAFEGSYTLRTSNAVSVVDWADGQEDPSGKNRKRNHSQSTGGNSAQGQVWWANDDNDRSKRHSWAHVEASNARVTLHLR